MLERANNLGYLRISPNYNTLQRCDLIVVILYRSYISVMLFITISTFVSQICPSLKHCSHTCGGALKSSPHLLEKVQFNALHLLSSLTLIRSLHSLSSSSRCRSSHVNRYFNGHCNLEFKNFITNPVRRVQATMSTTQSHHFQVVIPNP